MARSFALLASLSVLFGASRGAADVLTVRFDTFGESAPSKLCVVSEFGPDKALTRAELESGLKSELSAAPHQNELECKADLPDFANFDKDEKADHRYRLRCTEANSDGGALAISLGAAVVTSVALVQTTARIEYQRPNQSQGPIDVRTLGGSYVLNTQIPSRIDQRTEALSFDLIPKCVQRTIAIPAHQCRSQGEEIYQPTGAPRIDPGNQRTTDVVVYNTAKSHHELGVQHCGHSFAARWNTPVPPRDITLEPTEFWFRWTTNCLAQDAPCPSEPTLSGAGVTCRNVDEESKGGTCHYLCTGPARFPAQVEFIHQKGSITQSWSEPITNPGAVLSGFIPPDQRRLEISWAWDCNSTDEDKCTKQRNTRANDTADRIDEIELRSSEGSLYRIRHDTTQVRMPELDCNDYVSYRYLGTRTFREELKKTDAGAVTLCDPGHSRRDRFGVGAGLGGGVRNLHGASGGYGLQGELQIIGTVRHLRDYRPLSRVDIEVRLAAILADQPFCSVFAGEDCHWERIPYWRFPITLGPNIHITQDWTLGGDLGVAGTTYVWATGQAKADQVALFATRMHVGYRLSRLFAMEFYWRSFLGEHVRERQLDAAGLVATGSHAGAWKWSHFFGFFLRVDDLF